MKRASSRKTNTDGRVLILQYHHIEDKNRNWTRKVKDFSRDLHRLYKLGYRPVTVGEYLRDEMDLPPGASPVILTFDDSHPNQFRMLPTGEIDPQSAVGIWRRFAEKRPDFPVKATFFVLPTIAFGQKKFLAQKMALLKSWGSEVEVHTVRHANLSKLTDDEVKAEIAGSIEWIRKFGFEPRTIALPYGIAPNNRALLKRFEYKGKVYTLDATFLAGSAPAPAPGSKLLNRYRIPRVLAQPGLLGSDYWLARLKSGKTAAYVR